MPSSPISAIDDETPPGELAQEAMLRADEFDTALAALIEE